MAFDYLIFKKLMYGIDAVGGFDKVLELELIDSGNPIHYVESAHIYDEKVSQSTVFSNQRTRWVSAQFYYLHKYFLGSLVRLMKGQVDYFFKTILWIFPPRLLFPFILLMLFMIALIIRDPFFIYAWGIALLLIVCAYLISIPRKLLWTKGFWRAIFSLPSAVIIMVLAMFKLKGANKTFIHTPHTHKNPIDDHKL